MSSSSISSGTSLLDPFLFHNGAREVSDNPSQNHPEDLPHDNPPNVTDWIDCATEEQNLASSLLNVVLTDHCETEERQASIQTPYVTENGIPPPGIYYEDESEFIDISTSTASPIPAPQVQQSSTPSLSSPKLTSPPTSPPGSAKTNNTTNPRPKSRAGSPENVATSGQKRGSSPPPKFEKKLFGHNHGIKKKTKEQIRKEREANTLGEALWNGRAGGGISTNGGGG